MARRVNTKFVVILSAALVGAVGVFGGVKYYRWSQQHNPDVVRALAEAAEQRAEKEPKPQDRLAALKTAAGNYASAAALLSVKHRPGADALYARSADLCLTIAREAQLLGGKAAPDNSDPDQQKLRGQAQEDAVRYYQFALDNYNRALSENPRNKAVNETLLEEDYQNAQFEPSVQAWKQVEEVAGKLINNQDGAKPRLYRAEARLGLAQATLNTAAPAALDDVKADLAAALRFAPDSGQATALSARLMWVQADLSARRRGLTKADEYSADAQYQRDFAATRQVLVNFLERPPGRPPKAPGWAWCTLIPLDHVDADVAATLTNMTIDQFRMSGGRDQTRLDEAMMLLEAAFAANPGRTALADGLGALYLATGHYDQAEALFTRIRDGAPDAPEGYFRLAVFYRDHARDDAAIQKAIACFVDVTNHRQIGVGREAKRNSYYQILALNEIAWLSLELAERPTAAPEQFKALLAAAGDYTDKLRAANAHKGLIDLLDGRILLVKRDIPHAVAMLRSAEANLNGANDAVLAEKYRQAELLLARANEQQNQLGAALDYVNKALELKPGDLVVLMQKGRYLMRLGRYEDTRILMGRILGETITHTQEGEIPRHEFLNEKALPAAIAEAAKSMWSVADARLNNDPTRIIDTQLPGNTLQVAMMEMDEGNYAAASADALTVLEKSAGNADAVNISAYNLAITCGVQLQRTEEARKLAAEALAKFPQNSNFQALKAQLDRPDGANTPEAQKAVIEAITDPYVRALALASLYHLQKRWNDEIKTLQAFEETLKNATAPDDRDKLGTVLDRLFGATLSAAGSAPDAAQKEDFWKQAQNLVTEIEKLNLDGTDGKVYRGKLEMARTDGKNGLQYLQQAVAQRPDYAYAHQVLGQAYLALANQNTASGIASSANNMNSALEEFRQVIRLAPNNIVALQLAIELLVRQGDSSSMKEAQTLLESGLAQAPHNPTLISFTEIFAEKVDDSIKMREDLLTRQPDDRNNVRRLAALYVRLKDKESDPDKKQKAMDRAIALLASDFKAHPTELATGDFLARLLVEYDKSNKGAAQALDIYGAFIASNDPAVRFNALIAKAEFFQKLLLMPEAIDALKAARLISHDNPREEAADVLLEAIKIEPAGQDDAERHLADMYFDLGRMQDAARVYLQVLDKNKNPDTMDRVTRRLIEAQLRLGQFAQAGPRLAALLNKQPKDIQGRILRAYASVQQGLGKPPAEQQKALKSALDDLNYVLSLDHGNADALFYRASAQLSLGDRMDDTVLDDAEKDLILAAKQDRSGMTSRRMLAELYVTRSRYEEAAREYRELLTLHPEALDVRVEYTDLLRNLALLQLTLPDDSDMEFAQSLRRLGPLDRLIDEVKAASEINPGVRWILLYAQALSMQNKEAEAQGWLQRLYENLLKQQQLNADVTDAYMGSLLKTKDYAKVVDLGTAVINGNAEFLDKNPQYVTFYLKRAAAYQALGKPDEAVQDVDRGFAIGVAAAAKSHNFAPFIVVLNEMTAAPAGGASADSSILKPELVVERLRLRIAANPAETLSKIGLIQTLLLMDQPQEALKVVETLSAPADDEALRFLVLRESALVRSQAKQYAAAEKDFLELAKLAPDNIENLNNYAFLLADGLKRPKEAITYALRARQLLATRSDPGQLMASAANVYDTLGWAYYLNNDTDHAIANLLSSIKVQPQAAACLHLALAYQKAGKTVEAQQKCQEGIKLAAVRRDPETLAALKELQTQLSTPTAKP